eukprot:185355-Hanusia_phi.AAC.6
MRGALCHNKKRRQLCIKTNHPVYCTLARVSPVRSCPPHQITSREIPGFVAMLLLKLSQSSLPSSLPSSSLLSWYASAKRYFPSRSWRSPPRPTPSPSRPASRPPICTSSSFPPACCCPQPPSRPRLCAPCSSLDAMSPTTS